MSKLTRVLWLSAGLASLVTVIGCGGSGTVIPHTTGNYSNASFQGSYVFQIHGFISANGNPYRQLGVITADGNGNITGGSDDTGTVGGFEANSANITGTYSISSDGTGQMNLSATSLGTVLSTQQITLAVTLTSSSEAYLVEADVAAAGAGTAELQDSTAVGTLPSGAFVFRLHDDLNANSSFESEVGIFTITGTSLSGALDQTLVSGSSSLTLTGNLTAPSSSGVGTATFTDSTSATTSLIYSIVNSTKFYFLVSNGAVGGGSAEAQTGNVGAGLAGSYVFGSRGDDLTAGLSGVATVGQFTGSGATISKGAVDSMQDYNYSGLLATLTGTPVGSPSAQGRVDVTLSAGPIMVLWMVSPARAYFLFENNGSAVEDGTADLQTGTSFTASTFNGQYAMVMDGIDQTPEAVSRVGLLQFDGSGHNTIVEVENDSASGEGAQSPGALSGSYSVGGSGRIATQVNSSNGSGPDLVLYAISGSQAYALQIDEGTNTSGTIQLQQ
jgi:hypothetical protein